MYPTSHAFSELLLPLSVSVSVIYPCMALLRDQLATWITLDSPSKGRARGPQG